MGGCANSKYAVDEDNTKNKPEHDTEKKSKKPFLNIKKLGVNVGNKNSKKDETEAKQAAVAEQNGTDTAHKNGDIVTNKEEIEFIDTSAVPNHQAPTQTTKEDDNDDAAKKEVTTYQTTVVKHTQKEGDELLQHLREEAFRSLSSSLKHLQTNTKKRTTATAGESGETQTVEDDQTDSSQSAEELISQVKSQVITSLGRQKQDDISKIVDSGVELIRESKVKSMNELEQELEKLGYDGELTKKVVNATTGFLTAKGTEAGALLSNILANVSQGIQGVMNETEKTTVKVTRTITEQVLSGGQIKEVTRVITEPIDPSANITDILKNFTSSGAGVKSGTQVTHSSTQETQEHESLTSNIELKEKAEKVVSQAVEAAVEKLADETTESVQQEEKIKIEEESTIKTSTTKIILNGGDDDDEKHLENVAAEFFKNGKHEAEIVVKKLDEDGMILVENGGEEVDAKETSKHDDDETKKKEDAVVVE